MRPGRGKYLVYGKAGNPLAADPGAGTVGPSPTPNSDFRVDVRGDAFTLTLASGKALATDGAGRLVLADTPGASTFPKAERCAVFPRVGLRRHRRAVARPDALGETSGLPVERIGVEAADAGAAWLRGRR